MEQRLIKCLETGDVGTAVLILIIMEDTHGESGHISP